jgi:ribosomal protein L16 Arg81 hydroxylase
MIDSDHVLEALFGDVDEFFETYWDQRPLHCRGQLKAADLVSVDAIDELLTNSVLQWPTQVRMSKDGLILDPALFTAPVKFPGMTNPPLVADPAAVIEQFLGGATILLQWMQRVMPPIGELCSALDGALTHNATATVFLAPPGPGLGRHCDPYDVIVVQVEGRKRWELHAPRVPYPLEGGVDERVDPGPPDLEIEMVAGDVLYLPKGWIHGVHAIDEVSLHVSVMVTNRLWLDLVNDVLADIGDDVELRRALPAGYAHDPDALVDELTAKLEGLKAWLDTRDLGAVARAAAYDFWSERRPTRRHQLAQALAVDAIDESTVVRGRGGADLRLFEDQDSVTLLLGSRCLRVPRVFAEPLRRLASGRPVVVSALSDDLADELRLSVIRQLVREGYLEVVDDDSVG